MRNFKRFLAMALTMLMLVSSLSLITSAKFEDVTDFQNEIAVLSNLGVIKGKADGTYGFDEAVTRRQTALFFARATTGKVDDAIHWQSEVNTTPFKDLDAENDFYGAISYCHNVGIVLGRSATEFAPNDNITFQEAVTMAVRALGYGGASMDAGYPWTYYTKAVSLGLDKGIEDVALTDVVSRGVMAKLIYNAMFATNSKGSTIAADAFGSAVKTTNLVLVATKGKTLVANLSTNASDKVAAFVEFNSDGTLNLDKVYHFNWADFAEMAYGEGAEEKAADHVGYSYNVVTVDNFKSLVTVSENPSKTFTSADYVGDGKFEDNEYTLVQKWSSVFNIGTTASGKEELIQYNTAYVAGGGKIGEKLAYYGNNWYVVDKNNNILKDDADGSILLYYIDAIEDKENIVTGASSTFPYYTKFEYKVGNDTVVKYYPAYLPLDGTRYNGAAPTDRFYADKNAATYDADKNADKYTKNVSAYTETVVYDDNNDGVYDRAYFTAYSFGQYKETDNDGDGHKEYNFTLGAQGKVIKTFGDNNNADVDVVIYNISGKELKNNAYILWAYDAVNNSIVVKKIFDTVKTGYVTGVDVINDTITFSNITAFGLGIGTTETVKYGVAKLPGATNTNDNLTINDDGTGSNSTEELIGVNYTLLHKYVSYIVDDEHDGNIIAIFDNVSASTPLVVTDIEFTSLFTFGGLRAYVIDNTGTAQLINISNINGTPAISYNYFGGLEVLERLIYNENAAVPGLVYGAKQTDGTWVISTNLDQNHIYQASSEGSVLTFVNGIAYENYNSGNTNPLITPKPFSFKAEGSSLVIIGYDATDDRYIIAKGVPGNWATLRIDSGLTFYAKTGYMYLPASTGNADFWGNWNLSYAYETGNVNDIIYLRSVGTFGGSGYTYLYPGSYFSILSGAGNGDIGAYITGPAGTNNVLTPGRFYTVNKAVQDGKVIMTVADEFAIDSDDDFQTVYIKSFSDNDVVLVDEDGENEVRLINRPVVLFDWTTANGSKITAQPKAGEFYKARLFRDARIVNKYTFLVTDKAYKPAAPVVTLTLNNIVFTLNADNKLVTRVKYSATEGGAPAVIEASDVKLYTVRYKDGITFGEVYEAKADITVNGNNIIFRNIKLLVDDDLVPIEPELDFVFTVTVEYKGESDTLSAISIADDLFTTSTSTP